MPRTRTEVRGIFSGVATSFFLGLFFVGAFFHVYEKTFSFLKKSVALVDFREETQAAQTGETFSATTTKEDSLAQGLLSITFDDGYLSAYKNGVPLLLAASTTATFYIISNYFTDSYMSVEDVLDLQSKGFEIGAHTRNHPNLTHVSREKLSDEVSGSLHDLEDRGLFVKSFAYPYGGYDSRVVQAAKDAHFETARTIEEHLNASTTDPYKLGGWSVYSGSNFDAVKKYIDSAVLQKQWAILVFHRVDEEGNPISITHEQLKGILDYIKESGVKVVTVSEGARIVFGGGE